MIKSSPILVASLALLLVIAYWIFSQGMGGGLYFDDMDNLALLSQVRSFESAMQFVFAGNAGPSGRPLSLASFAMQAEAWPNKPEAFIRLNILIHLINGALAAWFSYLLANSAGIARKTSFVSLLTALWLLSPIQVSPVLFIVQRMTLLAGFFTLLGLVFYLLGRMPRTNGKPSWLWIALAFAMTIPATLSKENGVLLPGFLLILEFFLFSGKTDSGHSALRTKLLAVWATGILLSGLLFLYRYWPSFAEGFAGKGHTLPQHMATEARIVVNYLSQFVMPNMPEFGPFHDDFPVSDVWYEPRALAAAAGLSALAGMAWWSRHRCPLFAAGVFIFLWGHALESSVIPLEIYFEHRNYIPVLGLAIALTGPALSLKTYSKFAFTGLVGLILLCAFSTHQYAAIWGQRNLSAQYWHSERPQSVRAVLYLVDYLGEKQQWAEVNQLVSKAWQANPRNMGLTMPMLYVVCRRSTEKLDKKTFDELSHSMREGRFSAPSAHILYRVLGLVTSGQCPALNTVDILTFLDVLGNNPHYQTDSEIVSDLLIIRANALFAQGHTKQSAELLSKAIDIKFRLYFALQAAKLFEESGNHPQSIRILELVRSRLPANPWLKEKWLMDIKNMEAAIAGLPKNKTHATE